jgi:glycosyltransferase involved in cell wall biosynthesis
VVHTHDAASQFTAALVRPALPRVPVLMTFHRSRGLESARTADRLRNALGCAASAAVVTVSQERGRHFRSENWVAPAKVVCIPNGIDTDRFHPDPAARAALRAELGLEESALLLGAVGHFGPEKGLDVVLRGYRLLAGRWTGAPLQLVVLGDGTPSQRQQLTELARGCRVQFAGFRRDVDRWFRALDLFVHAPRQEAFGLVAAEAMATAVPVVAARVGGLPEVVSDGVTGVLVPPDDPPALADALAALLTDPQRRRQLGRAGRERAVAAFGAAAFARRYLCLYQALCARRPPGSVADGDGAVSEELTHV